MYMILCKCWDDPEGDPGQRCVHLFARILSTSFSSVSIFSVCCYSSVSISMFLADDGEREVNLLETWHIKPFA